MLIQYVFKDVKTILRQSVLLYCSPYISIPVYNIHRRKKNFIPVFNSFAAANEQKKHVIWYLEGNKACL